MMEDKNEILEELRKIRKLLEPKPAPSPPAKKSFIAEFMDFITRYKVLGMAVAFIIGLYLGALVQALVSDLIMPIIQFAIPETAWENIEAGPFRIGHFFGTLVTFLMVALVIFLMVRIASRWGLE